MGRGLLSTPGWGGIFCVFVLCSFSLALGQEKDKYAQVLEEILKKDPGFLLRNSPILRLQKSENEKYQKQKDERLQSWIRHGLGYPKIRPNSIPSFDLQRGVPTSVPMPLKSECFSSAKLRDENLFFLSFGDQLTQGLALDRLDLFAESKFKGHVLSDATLKNTMVEMNTRNSAGSDFSSSTVAQFFSAANTAHIRLNPIELRLRDALIDGGLLKSDEQGFVATSNFAIVASTAPTEDSVLRHEFNHGKWFLDDRFRKQVLELWSSLPVPDRSRVESILKEISEFYDFNNDKDLLLREFVAYFNDPEDLIRSYLSEQDTEGANFVRKMSRRVAATCRSIDAVSRNASGRQRPPSAEARPGR